jgi:acyl dehydratase
VPKSKHAGGIVVLRGTCTNQDGVAVADADARMLVAASG